MDMDPIINGGIAFAAVLILMVLNIPIGIAMLLVGFTGFALISGFDPASPWQRPVHSSSKNPD